jgi:hypothetical protein
MNKEEYRAGLWQKKSEKGTTYYSGKLKMGEREFYLTLFKNNKTNEKQPDLNIIVRDSINTQEKQENTEKGHKNSELGENKQQQFVVDDVFTEFGNMLEDEDVPF